MKVITYTFTAVLLLASLTFCGCKDEEGVDPNAAVLNEQLSILMNSGKPWVLGTAGSVKKDNVDVGSQFAGFKLTIGNKTYNTQNSLSHVFKASGTWGFQGNDANVILKDGSTEVSVSNLNGILTLRFNAAGTPQGGRASSVSGEYVFNLVSE